MPATGGQDASASLPPLPDSGSLEPSGLTQPGGQVLPSTKGSQQAQSQAQSQEGPLGQPGDDFAGLDADGLWSESLWGRWQGKASPACFTANSFGSRPCTMRAPVLGYIR